MNDEKRQVKTAKCFVKIVIEWKVESKTFWVLNIFNIVVFNLKLKLQNETNLTPNLL